jgi:uncharacterized protein with FMN-binding domain
VRRTLLTVLATLAGVVLLLSLKPHHASPPVAVAPQHTGKAPAPTRSGGTRNGTVTGQVVETKYGPVQVAAVLTDGRLTGVKVLQTPSGNGRDRRIAARAVPQLTKEALAAHSAHISAVSGASYTSAGYTRSLQSALDAAHG